MSIPSHPPSSTNRRTERVNVYVDGFNFYHGLMAKGWGRYRWLDYPALLHRRIRDGQVLGEIKYFTALLTHQPERINRQAAYLRALDVRGGITTVQGTFELRAVKCSACSEWHKRPKERQTDVNIATHLLSDAYEDAYDTAYLVCADADLAPAIRFVRERCSKEVVLIDPPRRHSDELAALADHHWHFTEAHIRQSQLPNPVEYRRKGKVRRIYRPEAWGPSN